MVNVVDWFPQGYAQEFYILKGLIAGLAVILFIVHMDRTWDWIRDHALPGQKWRYFTMLAFTILLATSSIEQVNQGIEVSYRNLGGFAISVMLVITSIVSLRDDHRRVSGARSDTESDRP